ncbi:WD40 repeat domain-containing serine/threonine protein kinase [Dactylosporangium sp. NPDC051541]|uniref:WD40 repeat domain-containing serine/threonine protein kinase n=1 Tax=Dactylosporangium sp. NPDC051541 TaxID=3363977 RepID=UPI0037975FB9
MFRAGDILLETYEVRDVIRSGGMGLVYRVHHRGWGVELAVKTPRPEFAGDELFQAEAENWVGLGAHPHTVSCAYVRQLDGRPAAFAEWVDGGSLADAVRLGTIAELPDVLDAAIQFAWGLTHAHAQGLVHQDVKPANAMREPDGTLKVTDFGLAAVKFGAALTPAYCSPEQMRAAAGEPVRLTPATDVWSWALSVLEMLVGGPPTRAGHIAGDVFAALVEAGLRLPGGLRAVLEECFRLEVAARPQLGAAADRLAAVYAEIAGRPYPRRRPAEIELRADGLSNAALSMLDLGHPQRAEELWEQALRADPHHAHTAYNRGLYRWRHGRITDADLVAELGQVRDAGPLLARVQAERGLETERFLELAGGPSVSAVACTPDVRLAVLGDEVYGGRDAPPAAIRLWDLDTGHCRHVLPAHPRRVTALAADPAGRFVVSGGDDGNVVVWAADSGRPLHRWEAGGAIRSLALDANGETLAALSDTGEVHLWTIFNPSQGYCLQRANTTYEHGAVAIGRGHVVLYSSRNRRLRVWTVAGELVRSGPVAADALLLSPDASAALLTGDDSQATQASSVGTRSAGGGFTELMDPVTGERLWRTARGATPVTDTGVLLGDGRLLLTPAGDTVQLWDVTRGRCLRTVDGHGGPVRALVLARPGIALTGSGDATARLWRLPRPGDPARWSYARPRPAVELSRDVDVVRAAAAEATGLLHSGQYGRAADVLRAARATPGFERDPALLTLWDTAGQHGRRGGLRGAWPVARLPEGSVLTPDGALAVRWRGFQYTLEVVDAADGSARHTLRGHGDAVIGLWLPDDGRTAVTAAEDRTVRVWDLGTGTARHVLEAHKEKISALAVTADGRTAISADRRGTAVVWDLVKGRKRQVATPHGGWIGDAALTADGAIALLFHHGGDVCVLDTATGRCLHVLPGKGVRRAATAIGVDGTVICPSHTGASLWVADVRTRDLRHMLLGHDGPVRAVVLSADSRRAASASDDGTVRVWDVETGRGTAVLAGHDGPVHALVAMPGDRFVVSGGADGTLRVWDLDTGECLRVLPAGAVPDRIGVAADGTVVFATTARAETAVWRLDWDYSY